MNCPLRSLLPLVAAALAIAATGFPVRATETANLRGYGKVRADITPTRSVFTCETVQKADILLDKLQADLFWDKTLSVKQTEIRIHSVRLTVYSIPDYGSTLVCRSQNRVLVLGGRTNREVATIATSDPLLKTHDVTSRASTLHPLYLDYYDNRAFKAYVPPMRSPNDYGLESHWPFLKSFGGSAAFFGPNFQFSSAAPGVVDWASNDYEVREAERQGGMVVLGPTGGGEVPLWVYNENPDIMMRPSATTALGDWGGAAMVGSHYESWSTPPELRQRYGLNFFLQTMERYRSSPSVGGWMPFAGSPGVEYNFHGRSTHSWDSSPAAQVGFRNWLQQERRLTLNGLGVRWFGDASHYSRWNDVTVPDINSFYGDLGPDSYRIHEGWHWRNEKQFTAEPISPQSPGWVPMQMPQAQQLSFVSRSGINYYDVTFDASTWRNLHSGNVWLVFGMIGVGYGGSRVWLNNRPTPLPEDGASRNGPFSMPVTNLLVPGVNHLQVALNTASWPTCSGVIAGPVFLTIHEPKRIPFMGKTTNARYLDLIDWQNWAMTDYHRQMLTLARRLDPDRPFVLSGANDGSADLGSQMCIDFGTGIENTGREANYSPENQTLGIAAGYYGTSEWSATPPRNDPNQGDMLERGFGWIMFDADSSHCLYHDIEAFQKEEKTDQWFTRHHRQINLFGKYLRQPKVALLHPVQSIRLNSPEPGGWDMGRGELQAAHFDNAYVTEMGLKAGLADKYPVLMDGGSEFMDTDTVAAIRRYVENGGTFIALHNTARHTSLEPDSYPLASVSGFRVSKQGRGGRLKFEKSLPFFKGWEGREFDGWGMAVDWQSTDHAAVGRSLDVTDPNARVLARWADGTPAIGYRKIGKGRIITLGTTFWRGGKDLQGIWRSTNELEAQFFARIFEDCGIKRDADGSLPELWARRMVTKNGMQNWLISYNSKNAPVRADVWMATDSRPERVISLDTNTPVAFTYEDGGVRIKNLDFKPYETKAFAVRRASLVGGLPTWWHEKTFYWNRTPVQIAAMSMQLPARNIVTDPDVIPLSRWRFTTDPTNSIFANSGWESATFNDATWKFKESGPWNLLDPSLKDYHGVGLYRIKFNLPVAWNGRRVLLNLFNWDTPIIYDVGEIAINGHPVFTYRAHYWSQTYNFDVSALMHPGENTVTVRATGGTGTKLGGLSACVWLEVHRPLSPQIDLHGTWQAVLADWVRTEEVAMPGIATAKCLRKTIGVPADWRGKPIFLEWASKERWVGCIVVNGQPICNNAFAHPFGLISRLNLTPCIHPGETNVIEVWPFRTMTVMSASAENSEIPGLQLDWIRIGVASNPGH